MENEFNVGATKFHGTGYEEGIDRPRLTSQLKRIEATLKTGIEYDSQTLCKIANVSFAALRNRISDLRIYHRYVIESRRIKNGLYAYKFIRIMGDEEYEKYMLELKKGKPIGNEELWGAMWQSIYAYSKSSDMINLAKMQEASSAWSRDVAHKLWTESKNV